VRTWQLWCLIAALAVAGVASSAQFTHLLPFMKDLRLSAGLAAGLFSLASAALLAGKLFFGYVSDRASPKLALLVAIAIGVAATLVELALLAWGAPLLTAILAAALVGAVAGSFTVIMPTLIGALFGTRRLGTLLGLVFLFAMSGMAVGPLVAGRMFDATGSYKSFLVVALALYGVGVLAAALVRPALRR
jgi:MFS family permease